MKGSREWGGGSGYGLGEGGKLRGKLRSATLPTDKVAMGLSMTYYHQSTNVLYQFKKKVAVL